jgi:hypothetical protein
VRTAGSRFACNILTLGAVCQLLRRAPTEIGEPLPLRETSIVILRRSVGLGGSFRVGTTGRSPLSQVRTNAGSRRFPGSSCGSILALSGRPAGRPYSKPVASAKGIKCFMETGSNSSESRSSAGGTSAHESVITFVNCYNLIAFSETRVSLVLKRLWRRGAAD